MAKFCGCMAPMGLDNASMPETFTEPSLVTGGPHRNPKRNRKRQFQSVHAGSFHEVYASRSKKKPEKAISKPASQVRNGRWQIPDLLKELPSPSLSRLHQQKQNSLYQMEQNPLDIDTRLPYRTGCPQLPALPLETEFFPNIDVNFPKWLSHCDSVEDILLKYKIDASDADPAYRFHAETPTEKHPTWLILADIDKTEDGIDAWRQAAKDIWNYLQRQGFDLSVEILDIRAYLGLKMKPILGSEVELLKTWDDVMFRIATTVAQRGHDLNTLDLVHQERRGLDTSVATVAITARDADSNEQWRTTVEALHEFLPPSLRVEVRYSLTIFTQGPPKACRPNVLSPADYVAKVKMGTSCGRLDSKGSGSLGGVVRLKGMEETFALTNHHVMFGVKPERPEDSEQVSNHVESITLTDEVVQAENIVATCPSDEDHKIFLDTINSQRNDLLAKQYGLVNIQNQDDLYMEDLQLEIRLRSKRIQNAQLFDRRFGWVAASSGDRDTPEPEVEHPDPSRQRSSEDPMAKWILDWCLIRIANNRGLLDAVQQPGRIFSTPARQYQSIDRRKHYNVAKCGRTSGWTYGIMSAARNLQRIYRQNGQIRPTDQPKINPAVLSWGPGHKVGYSVLPRDGETTFLDPGDSGSFVLLDQHTDKGAKKTEKPIIGLGFGHNSAYNISYMMSMDIVVKDIEYITGKEVEQPSHAGNAPDTKEYLAENRSRPLPESEGIEQDEEV